MNPTTPSPASPGPAGAGRSSYIDHLRGWSILGVVCIHFAGSFVTTDAFAWSPSFYLGLILNQVFIFAVPTFVFLSGLLAGSSRSTQTLGEYYRGRFLRIAYPYLLASIASFFLLNHYAEWLALPDLKEKIQWLILKVTYLGVEPTLYFIPFILLLYVVQPALKALPHWLNRLAPGISPERFVLLLTLLLLVLHVTLGVLCFRSVLNYYVWGRPDPLFWMFYFFAGLHFRTLTSAVPARMVRLVAGVAAAIAVAAMAWNFIHHTNRSFVGEHFERNNLDLAYVRPEILIYDLAVVLFLSAGLLLNWSPRASVLSYLGRYTLEIYLWHILVLYYGAWRYAEATGACREMPELIVLICAGAAFTIAGATDGWDRLKGFLRHHRLALVEVP